MELISLCKRKESSVYVVCLLTPNGVLHDIYVQAAHGGNIFNKNVCKKVISASSDAIIHNSFDIGVSATPALPEIASETRGPSSNIFCAVVWVSEISKKEDSDCNPGKRIESEVERPAGLPYCYSTPRDTPYKVGSKIQILYGLKRVCLAWAAYHTEIVTVTSELCINRRIFCLQSSPRGLMSDMQ
jgi:hypothetical protein